jgi:hypothetical protein
MTVRILLAVVATTLSACGSRGPVAIPGAPDLMIPGAVAQQLDQRWSGWQVVPAAPAEASACRSRFSEPSSTVVTGDWNGDGTTDLAFQIATSDGRRVVAVFERLDGEYLIAEVTAAPDTSGVLGVERKASAYRTQPDGVTFYYGLDTIAFGACAEPERAYFWTGTTFEGRTVYE